MEQRKSTSFKTTFGKVDFESTHHITRNQADLPWLRYICLNSVVHEVGRSCRHTPGHSNTMPSWQNSLSLTNTWNKTAKTNSSPLKIGKRGRPTVKFPATKTFSLVPFFARNSIDSVTPLTKELVTEVMEKKSFTQVIFDSLGGEQVSSVEEYNKTATYTPGCRTSHLDVSRDKEALKAGPWFKNYKKLGGSNQKEVWNDIWILMLKTTSSENPVCRLDFPFKEAQIRPFKSYPKNLCQVNSKKKQQISKCKFNCIAYTAKKQVWEKGIKVPWLSAMEECIVPLQWCYLKKGFCPKLWRYAPPHL